MPWLAGPSARARFDRLLDQRLERGTGGVEAAVGCEELALEPQGVERQEDRADEAVGEGPDGAPQSLPALRRVRAHDGPQDDVERDPQRHIPHAEGLARPQGRQRLQRRRPHLPTNARQGLAAELRHDKSSLAAQRLSGKPEHGLVAKEPGGAALEIDAELVRGSAGDASDQVGMAGHDAAPRRADGEHRSVASRAAAQHRVRVMEIAEHLDGAQRWPRRQTSSHWQHLILGRRVTISARWPCSSRHLTDGRNAVACPRMT